MDLNTFTARRDWALERLNNAIELGHPAHIERCRLRYEGLAVKVSVLEVKSDPSFPGSGPNGGNPLPEEF